MNETEICKQIVQKVFGQRTLANVGLIDNQEKQEVNLRAALWKAAGLNLDEGQFTQDNATKGKKLALVTLYKTWSAFSKGLRHTFIDKQMPVTIPKIGNFFNLQDGEDVQIVFCASKELQRLLDFSEN